jgi:hypothetical protein
MSISASTVRASQNGRARAPDTLQQQREIELCIGVVRRYPQGAQAFDGGLNASLPVQQVTKVVPSVRERRIDARCGPQSRFSFNIASIDLCFRD